MKNWREKLAYGLVFGLFLANFFVWLAVYHERPDGILRVSFFDVGQGDAILIEAPNRNQILIDGGPGRTTLRALGRALPFYDRSIDLVIATHPDADHIGGLPFIFDRFFISGVMDTKAVSETDFYNLYKQKRDAEGAQIVSADQGLKVVLEEDVYLEILWPDANRVFSDTNTGSISGRLVYGEIAFMLTGDLDEAGEKTLISLYGKGLESDVLKAGHHGSDTSSNESFVGFVSPDYAVISAGRDNRYGHPHARVLETFTKIGAEIFRTDQLGTIVFKSDGKSVVVE